MENTPVYGMYIDADNVSPAMCEHAIEKIKEMGQLRFVKAYGNWQSKKQWRDVCLKHGVVTNHRYNHTHAKNSADMSLVIDATLDTLKSNLFDTIFIVSSDSDFMPLMQRATMCGKKTMGFGEKKVSKTYKSICDEFIFFEDILSSNVH